MIYDRDQGMVLIPLGDRWNSLIKLFLKIPLNKHEYTLGVIKQLTTMH